MSKLLLLCSDRIHIKPPLPNAYAQSMNEDLDTDDDD